MDDKGITVVRQGMGRVRVPVGTEHLMWYLLQKVVNREPAELVRSLVPTEDSRVSFQFLRLSAIFYLSHLLHSVLPFSIHHAAADYDVLMEWTLSPMVAGDRATAAGYQPQEK